MLSKVHFRHLVLSLLLASLTAIPALRADDISVQVNGGENVIYLGRYATVEWLFTNQQLEIFGCWWEFTHPGDFSFDMTYGNSNGLFQQCLLDLQWPALVSWWRLPDTLLFGGTSLADHLSPTVCYSARVLIPDECQPEEEIQPFCVNMILHPRNGEPPIFVLPSGVTVYPTFQGQPGPQPGGPFPEPVCFEVRRPYWVEGDADGNGIVTVSDAVYVVAYIFAGGPAPDPLLAGDADCNGIVTVADAVFLINYIFAGGPAPCGGCA